MSWTLAWSRGTREPVPPGDPDTIRPLRLLYFDRRLIVPPVHRPAGRAPQAKTPALAAPLGRYRRSVLGGQAVTPDPKKGSRSHKTEGRLTPKLSGRVV